MKIAFLCSSLRAGADGVGDYSRRLAAELIRQGQDIRLISVCDTFEGSLGEPGQYRAEQQISEGTPVETFRMSRTLSWSARRFLLKAAIEEFSPEFISLQYVPHGFHPKGIPISFVRTLSCVPRRFKWSITFHELCVGFDEGARFRHRVIGLIQKQIISTMMATLKPSPTFTQSDAYRAILSGWGYKVARLPLFGNISRSRESADAASTGEMPIQENEPGNLGVTGVIFGEIPAAWKPERALSEFLPFIKALEVAVEFVHVGKTIRPASDLGESIRSLGDGFKFRILGRLSECGVSKVLERADFGIAVTPTILLQKSGTVAAMMEHGLPIFPAGYPYVLRERPHYMTEFDRYESERLLTVPRLLSQQSDAIRTKFIPVTRLPSIAAQFVAALSCNARRE